MFLTFILLAILAFFIEKKYSPRFETTRDGWILLYYGPPSKREYIRLFQRN